MGVQILSIASVAIILDDVFRSHALKRLQNVLHRIDEKLVVNLLSHQVDMPFDYRLSLISLNGVVLYDSAVNASSLENHQHREEVSKLLKELHIDSQIQNLNGQDISKHIIVAQRFSPTFHDQTLYVAHVITLSKPLIAHIDSSFVSSLIVRVSDKKQSLHTILLDFMPYWVGLLLCGTFLSAILASFLSGKIVSRLANIDLEHPLKSNPYPELHIFMQRIAKQKKKIKKQIRIIKARAYESEMVAQNISEGFLLLHPSGKIRSSNPKALQYLNINAQSNILEHSHLNELKLHLQEIVTNPVGESSFEYEIAERNLHIIMLPVLVESQLKAIVLLLLDQSSQKQIQNLRKEFSANVTHELKTPLSVILASSEMLQSGLVKKQDEIEFITKIHTESKRLLTLIDKILRLSFFDEGQLELEKSPLDMFELLRRVSLSLEPLAKQKQIHLDLHAIKSENHTIWGVSSLIEDMAYNLIENAIKYSPSHSCIHITLTQETEKIKLCVSDEGIGIPKQFQERVFERFYCVDKSRSKKLGGSGLGLSIVKHIARIHNAKITLQSEVGKGTSISVEFMKN